MLIILSELAKYMGSGAFAVCEREEKVQMDYRMQCFNVMCFIHIAY